MQLIDDFFKIEREVENEEGYTAEIRLNPNHLIYKCHFPVMPITPGVCIVQMATEILERKLKCKLQIAKVINAKFVSMLSPIDNPVLSYRFQQINVADDGSVTIKNTAFNENTVFAKISVSYMICRYVPTGVQCDCQT